ncbi:DMT family transporter [Nocardiopsis ganjiahuensis]|uniref:DMT family transporter n=1 Tax=Nocardiopsis ganjiahuensis TaxID=239984 RepID=UPI000683F466|nr:DMT family transporter [Nocardiopsis ganjiahuensis]
MVNPVWLGVALGVLSCAAYTAAAVAQWRLAVLVPEPLTGRHPLAVLLRHPLWWVSAALNAGRAGFQVGAVGLAPLTMVQPLGVLVLVFAVPWAARAGGRRVTAREWHGAFLTVVALGLLLAVAVTGGQGHALGRAGSLLLTAGTLVLLGGCSWIAGRCGVTWRGYLLAAAAGIAFGVSSALARTATTVVGAQGVSGVLHPAAAGAAIIAVLGLFLAQAAYQGVELGAPLGVTTVVNPIAAATVGVVLMGESYSGGWSGAGVAVLCAILGGYGIVLLTVERPGSEAGPSEGTASAESERDLRKPCRAAPLERRR